MAGNYRFSFGPWNIHEGADPFGPTVRPSLAFSRKLKMYKQLGFDGVQFHDDDAVPDLEGLSAAEVAKKAAAVKKMLDDEGLVAEFVAPRLWEHPNGIDGGFTANDPQCRRWANDRAKRSIDIANALGTRLIVPLAGPRRHVHPRVEEPAGLAPLPDRDAQRDAAARPPRGNRHRAEAQRADGPRLYSHDRPRPGHRPPNGRPERVGGLIETAHALLAGLDPSDEMAFALTAGKLWSVHLNDQNGLKFDQDKSFGAANLRGAYNQVRVLELAKYYETGRFVGLDVKAMRSQKADVAHKHLANSRAVFLKLVDKVRSFPADVARTVHRRSRLRGVGVGRVAAPDGRLERLAAGAMPTLAVGMWPLSQRPPTCPRQAWAWHPIPNYDERLRLRAVRLVRGRPAGSARSAGNADRRRQIAPRRADPSDHRGDRLERGHCHGPARHEGRGLQLRRQRRLGRDDPPAVGGRGHGLQRAVDASHRGHQHHGRADRSQRRAEFCPLRRGAESSWTSGYSWTISTCSPAAA